MAGAGGRGWRRGSRPGRGGRRGSRRGGTWVSCSGGADLAEQVGGELVGHAEAGAECVAGDGTSVAVLVFGGDAAGVGEQRVGRSRGGRRFVGDGDQFARTRRLRLGLWFGRR